MKENTVIAEIGCNHKGDIEIAKEMIRIAAEFCKVDVVKFQKRTPRELLTEEEYNAPHPNPMHAYGATYGEHRERLELSIEQHKELFSFCNDVGIMYSTSVWDTTSAREIIRLNPSMIKIPSACNTDHELLSLVASEFGGEIHVSFGMTSKVEEEQIIQFFRDQRRMNDLVLYSCISGYPVDFEDLSLLEIKRMKEQYGSHVKAIGFSGHHLGIAADIPAMTLGATYFQRQFTLDRTWKGTDHAASLELDGMRRLARDIRNVAKALTYKREEILDVEKIQRKKLKRKTQ